MSKEFMCINKAQNLVQDTKELANKYGISTKKLIGIVLDSKNDSTEALDDKYSVFGNPDEKQKEMIDSWEDSFRNQMEGVLIFTENTTIIELKSGKELVFDKEQPISEELNWKDSVDETKKIDRKLLSREDFDELFEIFDGKRLELSILLNIDTSTSYYWSSTVNASCTNNAWYGDFNNGYTDNNNKDNTRRTLCIHN